MSAEDDYWSECIWSAADECALELTAEQHKCLAESVQVAHENYGMAFYSPSPSDRLDDINSEWEAKLRRLQAEFDAYKGNAETAVRRALKQYSDAQVTIGDGGEVWRHGGRSTQIQ